MRELVSNDEIGVNKVCKLFKISKKTFYQCKDSISRFLDKYKELKAYIRKIIKKNPKYGVLRIKAALKEKYKIGIGRDTLGKLLKLWELDLPRKIKKSKISFIQKILIKLSWRANLLIRRTIVEPFQAITSDITKIEFQGGVAYLCVHKDVFGQMVYGWDLALDMKLNLVMNSFKQAVEKIKSYKISRKAIKKVIWHQDQGSQYTSYKYVRSVLDFGKISFSKKGTPTENPGQESFFGRFKDEYLYELQESKTFEELRSKIKRKIDYYNKERIHTSIGYRKPKSFTESFLNSR